MTWEQFKSWILAATARILLTLGRWIKGTLKSFTFWFGIALVAAPEWWPMVEPVFVEWFGEDHAAQAARIVGAITIILRIKTNKSLPDKA